MKHPKTKSKPATPARLKARAAVRVQRMVRRYEFTDNKGKKMTLRGDMTICDLVKLGIKEIGISGPDAPLGNGWFRSEPMNLYPHKCKRCKCKFSNNQKDCAFCCVCEIRNIRDEWDESPNETLAGPTEPPLNGNRDATAGNEDAKTVGPAQSPNDGTERQPPGR
jgi:hypothetical protein